MVNKNKYLDKDGLKTFLGLVKENFAIKTDVDRQISELETRLNDNIENKLKQTTAQEFRFFNITVEGTVTVKFIVEGETIYEKSFTDTSVQIALPDSVTKFEEIVIEGEGKITSCECPIIVDCSQPWERDCQIWKNTTFDFSTSAARSKIINKGGVKIINLSGWYTEINPTPSQITLGKPQTHNWIGIAYSSGLEDSSWTFWENFIKELNRIHDASGLTPMFWWNNSDVLGLTDVAVETFSDIAIRLDKQGLPWITSTDFGPFRKLGWFDANDCEALDLSIPTLEVLLIGNLGCNLNVAKAHLDDVSLDYLAKFAKTVTNKTITFSGYNFYRLTETQRKSFVDKGFNIAVNWDNDEMYKFMYEASNPTTLSSMIDDNNTSMTLTAEDGMWFTESDDDVNGRTFANKIITNDSNLWIQVTNEYKEEYEKKIKEEMDKNLKEMIKKY